MKGVHMGGASSIPFDGLNGVQAPARFSVTSKLPVPVPFKSLMKSVYGPVLSSRHTREVAVSGSWHRTLPSDRSTSVYAAKVPEVSSTFSLIVLSTIPSNV